MKQNGAEVPRQNRVTERSIGLSKLTKECASILISPYCAKILESLVKEVSKVVDELMSFTTPYVRELHGAVLLDILMMRLERDFHSSIAWPLALQSSQEFSSINIEVANFLINKRQDD